jgi:DNA-binding transcriptional regulator YiaG
MSIRFEWDPAKNDANQRKHSLRFEDAKPQERARAVPPVQEVARMTDDFKVRRLTERDFKHMIRATTRRRIMEGRIESGKDIVALRRFTKLSQKEFARALEISVHTLRNWEQGRRQPEGPAIALLKIAARHPNIVRRAAGHDPSAAKAKSR